MPEPVSVWEAEVACTVRIEVYDDAVIRRPVENEDGWRDSLYPLDTETKVIEHLAYNCAANNQENGVRLDGWADLPPEALHMQVKSWRVDDVMYLGGIDPNAPASVEGGRE